MTTATQNLALQLPPGYFGRRNLSDWLFALFVAAGAGIAFALYSAYMDGYEQAILIGMVPSLVALAWFWRPVRQLTLAVAAGPCHSIGKRSAPGTPISKIGQCYRTRKSCPHAIAWPDF